MTENSRGNILIHSVETLKQAFQKGWAAETSFNPAGWSVNNPSYGQCAITALIVQDIFGGDIKGADVVLPDGSLDLHFFNVIGGAWIDLTRDQFPAGSLIKAPRAFTDEHPTTRDFILSYESTRKRYAQLCVNMNLKPVI